MLRNYYVASGNQSQNVAAMKQQCETRTRLIYFNTKFLAFVLEVFNQTEAINPFLARGLISYIKEKSKLVNKEYTRINTALNHDLDKNSLKAFNETLDLIIEDTTNFRKKLLLNLELFLKVEKTISFIDIPESQTLSALLGQIQVLSSELISKLDAIILSTKTLGVPKAELKEEFEGKLKRAKEQIIKSVANITEEQKQLMYRALLDKILQYYFYPVAKQSCQVAKKILLLQQWHNELKSQSAKLIKSISNKNISYALKIKKLLFDYKPQFYRDFFQHVAITQRAQQSLLTTIVTTNPEGKIESNAVVRKLLADEKAAASALKALELSLQDYSWSNGILTALIRFWTKGYFYQFSESYFDFFEELTDKERGTLRDYSILNTKLSDNYLSFFTTIGSGLLVKVNCMLNEWIGIGSKGYFGMLNVLFTTLLSQLDSFTFYLGENVGINDELLVKALPIIRYVAGLGVAIFTCAIGFGLGVEVAGYIASGYILGTLCQDLSGLVIDKAKKSLTDNSTSTTSSKSSRIFEFGVKMPIQHLSFCLGSIYFGPKAFEILQPYFVTPPRNQLLTNRDVCLKFEQACKQEAFKTLGFNQVKKDPTAEEIHIAWRNLMSIRHPDKNRDITSELYAAELNNARDRLKDLGGSS